MPARLSIPARKGLFRAATKYWIINIWKLFLLHYSDIEINQRCFLAAGRHVLAVNQERLALWRGTACPAPFQLPRPIRLPPSYR